MKHAKRAQTGRRLLWLLIALAAIAVPPRAPGVAETQGGVWPEAVFIQSGSKEIAWRFEYDDAFFDQPDTAYSHKLAQASLGMALSAFRKKNAPLSVQGDNAHAYLSQAGFQALKREQYDMTPTKETVATLIGMKPFGDATVIAVAVCGGNYADEWLSNFDIGGEADHAGFGHAAGLVEARIRQYIQDQGVTGDIKLWISGYSRGAAVTNLTAARMTDSGLFAGVYAYTFATPRSTRQPRAYQNIFNIVGKFDPVTGIPFAEWGYGRHGVDLYTPAQETDTDYRAKKAAASVIHEKLTGIPFWNNAEHNHTLKTICDFLSTIMPSAQVYKEKMQPILESVLKDKGLPNLTGTMMRLMDEVKLLDDTNRMEMDSLLDYLSMNTYSAVIGQAGWNEKTTMADNLMHEHYPTVYLSWMCSADSGEALFSDSLHYVRLSFQGRVKLVVANEGGFCLSISEDGVTSDWTEHKVIMDAAPPLDQRPLLAVARKGTQTLLTLPKDKVYIVMAEPLQAGQLTYFGTSYTVGALKGEMQDINLLNMEEGQFYTALSVSHDIQKSQDMDRVLYADNDFAFNPWSEELPYSPAVIMMMETQNVFHLTWSQMIWILIAAALLLIAVITLTVILIVRKRRRRKRPRGAQPPRAAACGE